MTHLKIVVDRDLCESNGLCTIAAPGAFELADDDQLHVLTPLPEPQDMPRVEGAVRRCPKAALSLAEEE